MNNTTLFIMLAFVIGFLVADFIDAHNADSGNLYTIFGGNYTCEKINE